MVGAWIFCRLAHTQLLAKSVRAEALSKGMDISASNPPLQRAVAKFSAVLICPAKALRVKSRVDISGMRSNIRVSVLLSTLISRCPVKSFSSALPRVTSVNAPAKLK